MPLITSKQVCTQQPQTAVEVDRSNPFGANVISAALWSVDYAGVGYKLYGANSPSRIATPHGICAAFDGSSDVLSADTPYLPEFSWLGKVYLGNTSSSTLKVLASRHNSFGSASDWAIYRDGSNKLVVDWPWIINVGVTTNTFGSDQWVDIALVRTGGLGAWNVKLYVNRVLEGDWNTGTNPNTGAFRYNISAIDNSGIYTGCYTNNIFSSCMLLKGGLSARDVLLLSDNPWQIIKRQDKRILIPSAGGGGITITCAPGNATTAGITTVVSSATTIACTPGGASTAGVACALPIKIACNVGNATPTGIACSLQVVVQCNAGTATTAGVSAGIALDSSITISCNAGTATTSGVSASFPQTLSCTPGNATTAGNSATFPRSLSCNVGNATTAGITAQVDIAGQIVIGCNAGTATTAGIQASVSSAIVLACNAGTATTLGATAYFPQSLQCSPGNAIAVGIDATFTVAGPTTIVCNVGNATASGISFSFGGTLVDAPNGSGPAIIIPRGTRQPNIGGIRI